jgi:hypothetical protein
MAEQEEVTRRQIERQREERRKASQRQTAIDAYNAEIAKAKKIREDRAKRLYQEELAKAKKIRFDRAQRLYQEELARARKIRADRAERQRLERIQKLKQNIVPQGFVRQSDKVQYGEGYIGGVTDAFISVPESIKNAEEAYRNRRRDEIVGTLVTSLPSIVGGVFGLSARGAALTNASRGAAGLSSGSSAIRGLSGRAASIGSSGASASGGASAGASAGSSAGAAGFRSGLLNQLGRSAGKAVTGIIDNIVPIGLGTAATGGVAGAIASGLGDKLEEEQRNLREKVNENSQILKDELDESQRNQEETNRLLREGLGERVIEDMEDENSSINNEPFGDGTTASSSTFGSNTTEPELGSSPEVITGDEGFVWDAWSDESGAGAGDSISDSSNADLLARVESLVGGGALAPEELPACVEKLLAGGQLTAQDIACIEAFLAKNE